MTGRMRYSKSLRIQAGNRERLRQAEGGPLKFTSVTNRTDATEHSGCESNIIISSPELSSGILSVQIHQEVGLGVKKTRNQDI